LDRRALLGHVARHLGVADEFAFVVTDRVDDGARAVDATACGVSNWSQYRSSSLSLLQSARS
jgi:hypothetical protein